MGIVVSNTSSQMEPLFNVTHVGIPIRKAHAAPHLAGVEIVIIWLIWIIVNVRDAKTSVTSVSEQV